MVINWLKSLFSDPSAVKERGATQRKSAGFEARVSSPLVDEEAGTVTTRRTAEDFRAELHALDSMRRRGLIPGPEARAREAELLGEARSLVLGWIRNRAGGA